jgi:hypothetical protein
MLKGWSALRVAVTGMLLISLVACRTFADEPAVADAPTVESSEPTLTTPPTPGRTPTASPSPTPTPSPTPAATPEPLPTPTPSPIATPEPAWTTLTASTLGVTVSYPPGFHASASSPALPLTIQNWDSSTVAWEHFPDSGLRIEISPGAGRVLPAIGEEHLVGVDQYDGFILKEASEVWDTPSRRITIEYSAHQQGWTIQGYIAEVDPDTDEREGLFHSIVATIDHWGMGTVEVAPVDPEPSLPRAFLTTIYLDAEMAILVALEESGHTSSLNNPWVQFQLERAYSTRHLYHLATAEVGTFNVDATDFLPWLVEYQLMWRTPEGREHFAQLQEHVWRQIQTAIHEPESEIGQRIRLIEEGLDPDFPG